MRTVASDQWLVTSKNRPTLDLLCGEFDLEYAGINIGTSLISLGTTLRLVVCREGLILIQNLNVTSNPRRAMNCTTTNPRLL